MKKLQKQQTEERSAQVAELSDEELKLIANYSIAKIGVIDPDPDKFYYLAADDNGDRPDSVASLKQIGYVVSEKKYHGPPGLVPMEIKLEIYQARQELMRRQNIRDLKQAAGPQEEGHFKTE